MERRLAAVLAADVAGYSRLMGANEEGTLAGLKAVRKALVDPTIAAHRGRIVKTTGDGMLVEFASAVDAVRGAVEFQRGMADHNASVPQDARIEFRIGIHVGDIIIDDNDIFGDGVNIAARLEGIAEPGGVCISDDTYRQVRDRVDLAFDDKGEIALKNIARPVRVFALAGAKQPATEVIELAPPLALPDKPSIAVLPFQNMSGDPEQEYFADGMVEEIITALSRNKQLFVIARNSSFTFKGRPVDIKQVARDLGVRYVLEGSVRKSASRVRVTGQLIDAATGVHLWADRFDGALEDVFELQDQVAASVVGAIVPSVSQAEMERANRKPTSSLDAYDCYLRGQSAAWQYTREATDQAIGLYEQAIALNSQFAAAYARLAVALVVRRDWGWSIDPVADASQAIACAESALRQDRYDAYVLALSAIGLTAEPKNFELADNLFGEVRRLNPNELRGWMHGGLAKTRLGDHQTAIQYLQHALRLSPLDPSIFVAQDGLALANFFLGNFEEGLKFALDVLRHHQNDLTGLRIAMACHARLGNIEAAQKLWQQLTLRSPSERVSDVPKRGWREQETAKIQEAYRLAGMPE